MKPPEIAYHTNESRTSPPPNSCQVLGHVLESRYNALGYHVASLFVPLHIGPLRAHSRQPLQPLQLGMPTAVTTVTPVTAACPADIDADARSSRWTSSCSSALHPAARI